MDRFGWKSWNYSWMPEELTLGSRMHEAEQQKRDALKEKVLQIKNLITSAPKTYGELQGQVEQLEQSLHLRDDGQEEVVFLTIGNAAWNNFKYFWESETKKPHVSVFVIAIPYFDLSIEGIVTCEHYTDEHFPEEVTVTSFNDYNLEAHHPDRIYFQIPYDSENPAMTVHPVFYSDALLKYTDELIYVPFLPIKTIDEDDDKSFYGMNFYVKMPGVLHADKIFLPTENLKNQYIRALTEFGGEEVREEFNRRIEVVDFMQDRRSDAKKKKIYFYSNAAFFVLHREKALDKLKRNLELFRENKDHIQLYWQISEHVDEVLQTRNPKIYEQLIQIMEAYHSQQWGMVVEPNDRDTIKEMDAFYGDPGIMAHTANALGMPVMLQNVEC